MITVYIIKNSNTQRHYIGCTSNLARRLSEHNRGQTRSTKAAGIRTLIYIEEFLLNSEAFSREKQIKSYKGGNAFKKLIARR